MKTTLTRIALIALAAALGALVLVGCAATDDPGVPVTDAPATDDPAAGLRLAPGLYDLKDGTVQALGTLEWQDLEGGFWALTGSMESEGNGIIAVLNNGAELDAELRPLEGKTVMVTGTRFEGASIRMAGPEVIVESFEEISDTPGAAE